jgi:hypothetical protein
MCCEQLEAVARDPDSDSLVSKNAALELDDGCHVVEFGGTLSETRTMTVVVGLRDESRGNEGRSGSAFGAKAVASTWVPRLMWV